MSISSPKEISATNLSKNMQRGLKVFALSASLGTAITTLLNSCTLDPKGTCVIGNCLSHGINDAGLDADTESVDGGNGTGGMGGSAGEGGAGGSGGIPEYIDVVVQANSGCTLEGALVTLDGSLNPVLVSGENSFQNGLNGESTVTTTFFIGTNNRILTQGKPNIQGGTGGMGGAGGNMGNPSPCIVNVTLLPAKPNIKVIAKPLAVNDPTVFLTPDEFPPLAYNSTWINVSGCTESSPGSGTFSCNLTPNNPQTDSYFILVQ